ncbi:hypothetical protein DRE_02241 [Drechslerella stenobrocha 248]|uniref:Nucleoside phosphorylase domain-containing protein n=1 Tax=Drechslerella stenobrocha 248 TaxID=1043628 RepID=W7I8V1_9PEZI|nr:hypothetical protein DRE_02241 [Drechslerella stenobrocha 248]
MSPEESSQSFTASHSEIGTDSSELSSFSTASRHSGSNSYPLPIVEGDSVGAAVQDVDWSIVAEEISRQKVEQDNDMDPILDHLRDRQKPSQREQPPIPRPGPLTDSEMYTIGLVCQDDGMMMAAEGMLDGTYFRREDLSEPKRVYTLGFIGKFDVVLGVGAMSSISAALVAEQMIYEFPRIRYVLMLGTGDLLRHRGLDNGVLIVASVTNPLEKMPPGREKTLRPLEGHPIRFFGGLGRGEEPPPLLKVAARESSIAFSGVPRANAYPIGVLCRPFLTSSGIEFNRLDVRLMLDHVSGSIVGFNHLLKAPDLPKNFPVLIIQGVSKLDHEQVTAEVANFAKLFLSHLDREDVEREPPAKDMLAMIWNIPPISTTLEGLADEVQKRPPVSPSNDNGPKDIPLGYHARRIISQGGLIPIVGGGLCTMQANLIVLPSRYVKEFRNLCLRNSHACPVLEFTGPGGYRPNLAAEADLRTEIANYRVYTAGRLTPRCGDILEEWTHDHVGLLLGSSYNFEAALDAGGVRSHNVKQNLVVPMYKTNIPLNPAGAFSGFCVVTMRSYPPSMIGWVREITGRYPDHHGEPIAWGWDGAENLGIRRKVEMGLVDFGRPIYVPDGEIPVFWASSISALAALEEAQLEDVWMSNEPGSLFVTDLDIKSELMFKNWDYTNRSLEESISMAAEPEEPFPT